MSKEGWATRVGVILAVTGSAVGLGNFLRFPGLAAQFEGGAFMVPYFVAFFIVGLPIAWVEWTMGRYGGTRGFNSMPGIFRVLCDRKGWSPYLGVIGLIIPVIIYMYYVYIEAWCLGFAINFLTGGLDLGKDPAAYQKFTGDFIGMGENGAAMSRDLSQSVLPFLLVCVILNFYLIWRGLSRGIELFCQVAMPLLLILAVVVLVRVLTLPGMSGGLAMTWNPTVAPTYLAAGDASLENFIAVDQARHLLHHDGEIENVQAFQQRLEEQGWTRPDVQNDEAAAKVPWRHPNGRLGLLIQPDGRISLFHKVSQEQALLAAWEPVEHINTLEPGDLPVLRLIASADEHTPSVETLAQGEMSLTSQQTFATDAKLAGWQPVDSTDSAGLWTNPQSKLRLQFDEQTQHVKVSQRSFLERLLSAEMWLAAAGQIFFSLSVGFGVIITYSSYMKRRDDVALSSLTAASGNGFAEVCLGGMITIPAAFAILGASGVNAAGASTFNLGFMTLPNVFAQMWMGQFVGFLFFFLLFLAAVTSSLSMLQPAIAFLEEAMGIGRHASVAILGLITIMGTFFVVYFSQGLTALDTLDWWITNLFMVTLALIQVILFGWVLGIRRGITELQRGAEIRLPPGLGFVIKFISPLFLLVLFGWWIWENFVSVALRQSDLPPRIEALMSNPVAQMGVGLILLVGVFFLLLIGEAKRRWTRLEAQGRISTTDPDANEEQTS